MRQSIFRSYSPNCPPPPSLRLKRARPSDSPRPIRRDQPFAVTFRRFVMLQLQLPSSTHFCAQPHSPLPFPFQYHLPCLFSSQGQLKTTSRAEPGQHCSAKVLSSGSYRDLLVSQLTNTHHFHYGRPGYGRGSLRRSVSEECRRAQARSTNK